MRQTQPEGLSAARARLRRDVCAWVSRGFLTNRERSSAKRDIGHASVNVFVEAVREWGVPWPKMVGKAIFAAVVASFAWVVLWAILVVT